MCPSLPCRHVPPIEQRQRLLLRISGQDDDPERRRRRGVFVDRRKDLTMTKSQGSRLSFIFANLLPLMYMTHLTLDCWPINSFSELTVYRCLEQTVADN